MFESHYGVPTAASGDHCPMVARPKGSSCVLNGHYRTNRSTHFGQRERHASHARLASWACCPSMISRSLC